MIHHGESMTNYDDKIRCEVVSRQICDKQGTGVIRNGSWTVSAMRGIISVVFIKEFTNAFGQWHFNNLSDPYACPNFNLYAN